MRSGLGAILLVALPILAGCASDVRLRHPGTGHVAVCDGGYCPGIACVMSHERQMRCISDFQRQGYQRATDGGAGVPTPVQPVAVASTRSQPGLNGTYTGEITGNTEGRVFTMRVTFTLVQSGDQVVGTWTTTGGTSGTVTGVLSENGIRQLRARQVNPCDGDYAGVAVVESENALRGSYVGRDCSGSVTASFSVVRQ